MVEVHVFEAPRKERSLFQWPGFAGIRKAAAFIDRRAAVSTGRLALWVSEPAPVSGPDAMVCVPLRKFSDIEARAAEVVDRWEKTWLLIESMPRAHREAARDDLRGGVATALLSAAISGVEDDVGF